MMKSGSPCLLQYILYSFDLKKKTQILLEEKGNNIVKKARITSQSYRQAHDEQISIHIKKI